MQCYEHSGDIGNAYEADRAWISGAEICLARDSGGGDCV